MTSTTIDHDKSAKKVPRQLTVDDIPTCSVGDRLILELVTDDEVHLEQLAEMIEENPSLSALMIGLANSAYFSSPNPILTVRDAIIKVLGMRMVRSIVLSVILGRSLDTKSCPAFSVQDYWTDSLTTGRFCQILVQETPLKQYVSQDEIYLAGLLSGLGQLVLIHHYPKEMSELLWASEGDLDQTLLLQQEMFGITQGDAGGLMGKRWVLPDLVVRTMQHNLDRNYDGSRFEAIQVVGSVFRAVNAVRRGEPELQFDEATEAILERSSADCNLPRLMELRAILLRFAKHLMLGD